MLLDGRDENAVAQAADRLAAGELVGFPTETVYGLGARADDDAAVAKVFAAKGRPVDHPLIVHVTDAAAARPFAAEWPAVAQRLCAAFWPGPLTVIVLRRPGMAAASAAGQDSIGLRCPAHPVAQALLRAAAQRGVAGVAAPSANRFGRISPTQALHVVEEFGDALLVLEGGACEGGIESTIVDCSRGRPVLLRPGVLTLAQLEAAAGEPVHARDAAAPRASGTLEAHYAPRAKLRLMTSDALRAALQVPGRPPLKLAVYSRTVPKSAAPGVNHRVMPMQAVQAANELFSTLRELDAEGAHLIWVEEPPATPEWAGVRDRLQRAAAS
ncbi:MAG TPA: L-threonylcarbamoyladenylate synthase [Rhizobacter sp.]|nr:L-threonylcarbamoyladenylate synthase [Rhizobacter sp.]